MDNWFLEELRYRKHERLAILGLVILILCAFLFRYIPIEVDRTPPLSMEQVIKVKDHLAAQALQEGEIKKTDQFAYGNSKYGNKYSKNFNQKKKGQKKYSNKKPIKKLERFSFDPNEINKDSLELLGFRSYIAERWVKFRLKGKQFYSLSDVKSIYGIDTTLVESLDGYYEFPTKSFHKGYSNKGFAEGNYDGTDQSNNDDLRTQKQLEAQYAESKPKYKPKKEIPLASIDLNTAQEDELMTIPGIGVSYSNRIIKYRSMLGGFHTENQLKSVYGMTDSLFNVIVKYFRIDAPPVKIKINTITEKELANHYLLSYKEAKIISAYRVQHGPYSGPEDFRKLLALSKEKKELIIPYIDFRI